MNVHQVEWTDEKVGAFWNNVDYLILNDLHVNDYFALLGGKDLMRVVNRFLSFEDKTIMDYGCGIGILTEEIMKKYKPAAVYACDTASESVNETKKRCRQYSNFKDAYIITDNPLPINDNKFDIIFVTEIVEHLSDESLDFLLKQVHRLLNGGGYLVVTTPNEENLKKEITVCPDCGCYYHRVQHVRSWNKKSLPYYVNQYGFKAVKAITMTLYERNSLKKKMIAKLYNLLMPIIGRTPRNLIYIAKKI